MKKKIILMIELVASILILYGLWDKNISISDNIAMIIPLVFIFGLMYIFIKD